MGKIALWKVVWGILLLSGLAWNDGVGSNTPRPSPECPHPVAWRDGSREMLLCGARAIRTTMGACKMPHRITVGMRLTVSRAPSNCVVRSALLPAATRLRMGLPLDLNRESARALTAISGIGPRTAARIVEGRPYGVVSELMRVRGIGPKRLAALGPYLTVQQPLRLWPIRQPSGLSVQRGASILRAP